MADQNLVVKMLLDANNYDKGMANAQKSVQKFVNQNMSLSGVLGTAGKALGAFGAAVGVAGGAVEAARKTIAATQTLTDEFGRTLEGAKSAVDSLFYSLASGNFDNFIGGLRDTIKYAKEAYNALDDLGTFQIFAGAQGGEIKQQREELKAQIKTGYRYETNADGSVSRIKMTDEEIAKAKEELKAVQAEYIRLIKQTEEKELKAYQDVARQILSENKFKGTAEDMDNAVAYYLKNYSNYGQVDTRLAELTKAGADFGYTRKLGGIISYSHGGRFNIDKLTPEQQAEYRQLEALQQIGDEKLKELMSHRVSASMAKATMYGELRGDEKVIGGKTSGGGKAAKTDSKLSGPEAWMLFQGESALAELENGFDDYEEVVVSAVDNSKDKLKEWGEALKKQCGEASELVGSVGDAFTALGNVVGGTAGDNIKAIGDFISAAQGMVPVIESIIASQKAEELQSKSNATASLYNASASAGESVAGIPVVGPAMAVAAIASVLSMAAAIKAIKFAEGGVVPGNNYTDGIQARISSGEVVLNSHDAKNLYDQIHSGRIGGGGGTPWVSGETIYIGLNNYLKASGRGQLQVR